MKLNPNLATRADVSDAHGLMPPRLRLSQDRLYERVAAKDPAFNGRFFFGVTTTGIYCLPSCASRTPHKPNVRFFSSVEEAREAGLRACKKCHPDDFARGVDPVLETLADVVREVRATPAKFPGVPALVKRSGYGSSRFFELLRQHYHTSPASLLNHARLEHASALLRTTHLGLLEIAGESGFAAQSTLHAGFLEYHGVTPVTYRNLPSSKRFEVELPKDFRLDLLVRFLTRDPENPFQRLAGDTLTAALRVQGKPALARFEFSQNRIQVSTTAGSAPAAHDFAVRLAGLRQDAGAFSRVAKKLRLERLVATTRGLRLPQESSAYSALVWSILGQQINVAFACTLRQRLAELCAPSAGEGLRAHPTPAEVAAVSPEALLKVQYSRQKADYLLSISKWVATSGVDLEGLAQGSATVAERTLLNVRGLGPWSVNYIMMRGLGFQDCVPYGDTGVTSGLQALFKTEVRPDVDITRQLMAPFSPLRSLATAHLWHYQR